MPAWPSPSLMARAAFKAQAVHFAGFLEELPRIRPLCEKLLAVLRSRGATGVLASLAPPANLQRIKQRLSGFLHIPAVRELALVYSCFSERQIRRATFTVPGLFGNFSVYEQSCSAQLCEPFIVTNIPGGGKFMGFMQTPGICRLICLDESLPFCGHVVNASAYSLEHNFDLGSFGDFFENYVNDIANNRYDIDPRTGAISMFVNYGNGFFSGPVIEGVQVQVSVLPHGDLVGQPEMGFTYRIRITFDPLQSSYISCRLNSRKWHVYYHSGKVDVVEGPGVIGMFPSFSEQEGQKLLRMVGEFRFSGVKASGVRSSFIVPIPAFTFDLYPTLPQLYDRLVALNDADDYG
eukprot:jgi/Hompol1/5159/HPOL_004186-RA